VNPLLVNTSPILVSRPRVCRSWTDDLASAIINSTSTNEINLKGIAIGNGWIDPKQQYPGYVDFAYEKGLIKKDTPVSMHNLHLGQPTDDQEAAAMEASLARCTTEMEKYTDPFNTPVNINNCGGVMDSVSAPFTQE
jgi:carboxypeptidase D